MFYIEQDNQIKLYNIDKQTLETNLKFQPQYQGLEIKEVPEDYTIVDFKLVSLQEEQEIEQQKERERLDMLFMTGSDVERAIYKVKGIDFDDILAMVKDNPAIDAKVLKIEFKANNFYRGNPYISKVGTLLEFTSEQMDRFFDTKDWHYLTNCNIKVTLQADEKPETEPIVTINGVETKETTLPYGSTCTIKVECEGYKTLQPEDFTVTEDMHIELQLIKEEQVVDAENSETGDNK